MQDYFLCIFNLSCESLMFMIQNNSALFKGNYNDPDDCFSVH